MKRLHTLPTSLLVLLATVATTLPLGADALERTAARYREEDDAWATRSSTAIQYFNICTGWIWIWSSFGEGDRVGVRVPGGFDGDRVLESVDYYFPWGVPAGYGYTSELGVWTADSQGCPETKLAGVAFIPRTGWNQLSWNLWSPETPFLLTFTFGSNENIPALVGIGTDHPAAGPSGPTSCGNCFPSNRSTHSFMYGSEADPICPGEPFDDGVCVAELMFVLHREFFDYVEPSSWGRVKHLYR